MPNKNGEYKYEKEPLNQGYAPDGKTTSCGAGGTIWCAN